MFLGWASPAAAANDLNCTDFGTRERAQREFLKNATDIHRLDADNDGKACEWNSSSGWWVWPIAGVALVGGRIMARRRVGDHRMVPGAQGVFLIMNSPKMAKLTKSLIALPPSCYWRE
jgi:hypothetical protein